MTFCRVLQPRYQPKPVAVWAPPLSLATTYGILSFPPGYLDVSVHPSSPLIGLCVQPMADLGIPPGRVSPFGHLRDLQP